MKTSIKTLGDVGGLHNLRTYTGAVRKSAKPALPTTAVIDLHMRRSEKDRLEKELKMTRKRQQQLQNRLQGVDKEMSKLLSRATQTAQDLRGEKMGSAASRGREGKLVLDY